MAVLQMTSDVSRIALTVRGEVSREGVEEMRAALSSVPAEAPTGPDSGSASVPAVEVDLREVTDFSRLGIAVLVAARRFFGDRLRIRGSEAVLALLDDAGLTRLLRPAA